MGQFDKFKKDAIAGAKKKELFKQEKRRSRAETEAFFKEKRKESRPAGAIPASKMQDNQQKSSPVPAKAPAYTRPAAIETNMALNKYISHSGICSRREAAQRVKAGEVKVNGAVETNPAYKVQDADVVNFNGKKVTPKQQLVYILLNKPKDFITTADDDKGRKTVLDIVKNATDQRIFPVGRLDRNTTGVLLLTNDGEMTQQLTHPSFEVRKIYEVTLDKPVVKADIEKLLSGVVLEDGEVHADAAGYADPIDKSVVGVEIHSGKNRVVRRMFEHLGYDVRALDRVMFANLTKKNVDRGKWRFLSEKEVRLLKFFNKSKRKSKPDEAELQDTPFSRQPAGKSAKVGPKKEFSGGKGNYSPVKRGVPDEKGSRGPSEKRNEPFGKRNAPGDKRDFSNGKGKGPGEKGTGFPEKRYNSPEKRNTPGERKDFSGEKGRRPTEKGNAPAEKWNFSNEQRAGSTGQKFEKKPPASNRKAPSAPKQSTSPDALNPDAKRVRKRIPRK